MNKRVIDKKSRKSKKTKSLLVQLSTIIVHNTSKIDK